MRRTLISLPLPRTDSLTSVKEETKTNEHITAKKGTVVKFTNRHKSSSVPGATARFFGFMSAHALQRTVRT